MRRAGLAEPAAARRGRGIGVVLFGALRRVHLHGAEHLPRTGPVIVAPNHAGFLDGPLLMGVLPRPVHFLVKQELFRGPLGVLLRRVGQIPVDRAGADRAALALGQAVLARGDVLGVFAEGTRGPGEFRELRPGLAWLALRSGAPVLPVACLGTARRGRTLSGVPGPGARVDVVVGRPFSLSADVRGRAALATATEQARSHLVAHLARAHELRRSEQ